METVSGTPAAIRTWWYPGECTGYEFIYFNEPARLLAMGVDQPVPATEAQTTTTEQRITVSVTAGPSVSHPVTPRIKRTSKNTRATA